MIYSRLACLMCLSLSAAHVMAADDSKTKSESLTATQSAKPAASPAASEGKEQTFVGVIGERDAQFKDVKNYVCHFVWEQDKCRVKVNDGNGHFHWSVHGTFNGQKLIAEGEVATRLKEILASVGTGSHVGRVELKGVVLDGTQGIRITSVVKEQTFSPSELHSGAYLSEPIAHIREKKE